MDNDDDEDFDPIDYDEPDDDAMNLSISSDSKQEAQADSSDKEDSSHYASQGSVVAVQRLLKGKSITVGFKSGLYFNNVRL